MRGTAFVFYSFRQNIFDFLLTLSSCARQSLNQMSEFTNANYHMHTPLTCFLHSVPFSKPVETTDDDLFPPIRPPAEAEVVLPSNDDTKMEEDADANADVDAEAATEDGSEEADESDEVCFSFPHNDKNLPALLRTTQDIEFIMEPANRSLDLRCVVLSSFTLLLSFILFPQTNQTCGA